MVMPPTVGEFDPHRPLECEKALRPGIDALMGWAVEAGWSEAEVDDAFLLLAVARQLARETGSDIEDVMQRAWVAVRTENCCLTDSG